jgi:hypothetical protein
MNRASPDVITGELAHVGTAEILGISQTGGRM